MTENEFCLAYFLTEKQLIARMVLLRRDFEDTEDWFGEHPPEYNLNALFYAYDQASDGNHTDILELIKAALSGERPELFKQALDTYSLIGDDAIEWYVKNKMATLMPLATVLDLIEITNERN